MYFNPPNKAPPKRFSPPNFTVSTALVSIYANSDNPTGTPIHKRINANARPTDTSLPI